MPLSSRLLYSPRLLLVFVSDFRVFLSAQQVMEPIKRELQKPAARFAPITARRIKLSTYWYLQRRRNRSNVLSRATGDLTVYQTPLGAARFPAGATSRVSFPVSRFPCRTLCRDKGREGPVSAGKVLSRRRRKRAAVRFHSILVDGGRRATFAADDSYPSPKVIVLNLWMNYFIRVAPDRTHRKEM